MPTSLEKSMQGLSSVVSSEDSDSELVSGNDMGPTSHLQDGMDNRALPHDFAPENYASPPNINETHANVMYLATRPSQWLTHQAARLSNYENTVPLGAQTATGLVAQRILASLRTQGHTTPVLPEQRSQASEPSAPISHAPGSAVTGSGSRARADDSNGSTGLPSVRSPPL